jgi:hypothetical protein
MPHPLLHTSELDWQRTQQSRKVALAHNGMTIHTTAEAEAQRTGGPPVHRAFMMTEVKV